MCNKFKSLLRCSFLVLVLARCNAAAAINGIMYDCSRLASSLAKEVCQDKYGFVWVATDFGLSKFDGYRFVNYYHDSNDSTTIVDNLITSFASTSEGRMFVGCRKGLMCYDYETDHFDSFVFPGGAQPRVSSIVETPTGKLLVSTSGHGVFVVDGKSRSLRPCKAFERQTNSLYVNIVHIEPTGHLWLTTITDGRLWRCRLDGEELRDIQEMSVDGRIVTIVGERGGGSLIATQRTIQRYDTRKGKLVASGYEFPGSHSIASMLSDNAGNLYIGTITHGLYVIRNGERMAVAEPIFSKYSLLSGMTVNSMLQDKDQNLWLTSPRRGLYLCSTGKKEFYSCPLAVEGGRLVNGISSITMAPDGGRYCVVNNKGLFHIDTACRTSFVAGSPNNSSCILCDSRGDYWLGTWSALYRYNPASGSFTVVADLKDRGTLFVSEDSEGQIYYTVFGDGFAILNPRTGQTKHYNTKQQPKNKGVHFGNNWVGQMLCDSQGLMWIATSSGVWCYDPRTDRFVNTGGDDGIMRETGINALCETQQGDIVIGTMSGLYVYDRKEQKSMPLPGAEALKDMKIMSMVRDARGDLWISTVKGIWQYRPNDKLLVSHQGNDGIVEDEFCSGAYFDATNGNVCFGGNSFVTYFAPADIGTEKVVGKVFLTRFATPAKVYSPFADSFSLPWDDNSFTVQFSLLDYKNAANVRYEYRINGGEWTAFSGDGNSLMFTKLKSGDYDIEVRAAVGGSYSSEVRRLSVTVEAPWYATTMAKLIYMFVALLIVFFLVLYFHRRQKARFDEEKMQLLINATHDIRSPLTMILGPVEKLKELAQKACDAKSRNAIDQYADIIDRNADRLLLLVNQILDIRKIDKRQMRLKCHETDMVTFVERICHSYEFTAEERGISLKVRSEMSGMRSEESGARSENSDGALRVWIDRVNFDKVVTNLLSNAFKYTLDAGEIVIDMGSDGKHFIMRVMDSGMGFGDEKADNLFRRFYQGRNSHEQGVAGTGIGLNLTQKIVELHGGTIEAGNRTDGQRGACLTVSLPLGNSHLKPEEIMAEDKPVNIERKKATFHKGNILVVDDDCELSSYVSAELNQWYRVDVYTNGVDALQALLSRDYDLVVSDVVMPGMDGITLLKKIKQNPNISHIPVILLSSKSEVADRLAGFNSGADAYVAKPFSIDELHVRIDAIIDNVRRLRGKYSGAQQQHDKVEDIEVKGYDEELMKRVMKSVNAHLGDCDFNVDTLAQDVGMSRAQLHRKIKEQTGVSTAKFVRNIRMEQAERLLREGKVNVTQVAYSVGFSDQAYFSTVFKQYYGVKPSEYGK